MVCGVLSISIFLALLNASTASSGSQCGQSALCNQGHVINGKPTCRAEFPWYVALIEPSLRPGQTKLEPFCGASIITPNFLLSAGHCFLYSKGEPVRDIDLVRAYPGFDHRSLRPPRYHYIKRIQLHQDWIEFPGKGNWERGNDLALIELDGAIDFSGPLSPVCLPSIEQKYLIEEQQKVMMAGFGSIKHFGEVRYPTELQKGNFEIINCKSENNICAAEIENGEVISSTCNGDSGGGLVGQANGSYFLVGVVSWGQQCGFNNFTSRFVNVFNHLDWINNKICLSEKGSLCLLPFKYGRKSYDSCLIYDAKEKASCPTKLDINGEGELFESCSNTCPGFKEPVNGGYGPWGKWSNCSQACGGGSRSRERYCNSPEALYGGVECPGDDEETEDCNVEECEVEDPNADILKPDEGFECKEMAEKCVNMKYLRLHKHCENLVKIYDDITIKNDQTEWETIFAKTCKNEPYAVCCVVDNTESPPSTGKPTLPTTAAATTIPTIITTKSSTTALAYCCYSCLGHCSLDLVSDPSECSTCDPRHCAPWCGQAGPAECSGSSMPLGDRFQCCDVTGECQDACPNNCEVALILGGQGAASKKVELWSPDGNCNRELKELPGDSNGITTNYINVNGGLILSCGGNTWKNKCYSLNVETEEWEFHSTMLIERSYHSSVVMNETILYLIGGGPQESGSTIEYLEPGTTVWKEAPDGNKGSVYHRYGTCTVQTSPDTFVITGGSNGGPEEYSFISKKWSEFRSGWMKDWRLYHGCTFVQTDKVTGILVAGGSDDPDPMTFSFLDKKGLPDLIETSNMNFPHEDGKIIQLNGRYFMLGGETSTKVEEYHPENGTWTTDLLDVLYTRDQMYGITAAPINMFLDCN